MKANVMDKYSSLVISHRRIVCYLIVIAIVAHTKLILLYMSPELLPLIYLYQITHFSPVENSENYSME